MSVLARTLARLRALTPAVNVLEPDQANVPHEYPGGFGAFLRERGAFVLVRDPSGVGGGGQSLLSVSLLQIDVAGPDRATTTALVERLHKALDNVTAIRPTPYTPVSDQPFPLDGGALRVAVTFSVKGVSTCLD